MLKLIAFCLTNLLDFSHLFFLLFSYMMIAPTIQQTRCKVWLQKHLPPTVAMSDVTSMFTALCIMGPFTRTLLSELTDTDLSPKNFPFFTFKMLDVSLANGIRTMNLTHTGELGYVMYIPNEVGIVKKKLPLLYRRYSLHNIFLLNCSLLFTYIQV